MSSKKPDDPISKVTFSPVSDGKTDALIVTIKTVKPEGQEHLQVPPRTSRVTMDTSKRSGSSDSKKKSRSTRTTSSSKSKSSSSQTSVELPVPGTSAAADASPRLENRTTSAEAESPRLEKRATTAAAASPRQENKATSAAASSPRLENPATSIASHRPVHTTTSAEGTSPRKVNTATSAASPCPGHTGNLAAAASPCLKHAAENISLKASLIPAEKVSMCRDCSKSMLSYIFLVQDFLESLAKEICGGAEPENCVQCMRQETRRVLSSQGSPQTKTGDGHRGAKGRETRRYEESSEVSVQRTVTSQRRQRAAQTSSGEAQREGQQYVGHPEGFENDNPREHSVDSGNPGKHHNWQGHHTDQASLGHHPGHQHEHHEQKRDHREHQQGHHEHQQGHNEHHLGHQEDHHGHQTRGHGYHDHQQGHHDHQQGHHDHQQGHHDHQQGHHDHRHGHHEQQHDHNENKHENRELQHGHHENQHGLYSDHHATQQGHQQGQSADNTSQGVVPHQFVKPMTRRQPDPFHPSEGSYDPPSFPHLESGGPDGLVSTLSTMEREVYDGARTGAGWDNMPQERLVSSSSSNRIASEAFVTMCRNNAEALGCLVVGTSLLLSRTSRTLCVVVSDGVSNAFRGPLSSVFHVVQCVRSMDSLGTTKLALLNQPELGISFEKLNVWRLVQFNKCVFLNPDTLVTQNCDELFCRDELSAVSDIGWPDCFNSGVFVFVPSIQTFWQLVEFAEKQGSYDGGDQGLLNSYFNNWSDDISKKLSFIYNLMANVSYTYTPAFKQFGRNVKVVQFHGSFKPWHVKFFSRTGQISPASLVHPTYVQFVHIWINIFRISALRQLSQEIQTYAHSQEVICAVELLRFFPLPTESESEFFLQPPSVRLRLAEGKMHQRSVRALADSNFRRKSAEFFHSIPPRSIPDPEGEVDVTSSSPREEPSGVEEKDADAKEKDADAKEEDADAKEEDKDDADAKDGEEVVKQVEEVKDENALPGAEVGNYMGMKAWEQGRMDYQGTDSSDNIIKRLEFLMAQPK